MNEYVYIFGILAICLLGLVLIIAFIYYIALSIQNYKVIKRKKHIQELLCTNLKIINLNDSDQENQILKESLKLACEEMIEDLHFDSEDDRHYTLQENIEYFKTMARKNIRGE